MGGSMLVIKTRNVGVMRAYFHASRGWNPTAFKRRPLGWLRKTFMAENAIDLTIKSEADIQRVINNVYNHLLLSPDGKATIIGQMEELKARITTAGGFAELWEQMTGKKASAPKLPKPNPSLESLGTAFMGLVRSLGVVPDGDPVILDRNRVNIDMDAIKDVVMRGVQAADHVLPVNTVETGPKWSGEADLLAPVSFKASSLEVDVHVSTYDVEVAEGQGDDPNMTSSIHVRNLGTVWGAGKLWHGDNLLSDERRFICVGKSRKEVAGKLVKADQELRAYLASL